MNTEVRASKVENTVKGAGATGGLALAACAVCCAPLIAAPVAGVLAAAGIGMATVGQIGIAVSIAAGGAGAYAWYRQRQRKIPAATSCGCGTDTSCQVPAKE